MNINQKFHLKQTYHEITFFAYDIEKVERITPYNLSRIFIPECTDRDASKGCDSRNVKEVCCVCYASHLQELLLDGWYVGVQNGFLDENSYFAALQTGIRVPVNKEVYDAWNSGWGKEPYCSSNPVYEL